MTPLILVVLAAMWAAVLIPPYLRDRSETKAAGSDSPMRSRLDALTSSFSNGRSYLPVGGSGPSADEVPLPSGARQPVGGPAVVRSGSEALPQSSAVQILGPQGRRTDAVSGRVTQLRPAANAQDAVVATPVEESGAQAEADGASARRSGSAIARRRRKDVLQILIGLVVLTLVATVAFGGPVLYLQLLADAALGAYLYLLVRHRKVQAEQEMKVAFLPHGGSGASATALLRQGGGWNPGTTPDNVRVLRAEAN